MIISHKYKYVFIQLDKTASTAIAKELMENYDGHPILWKHARYEDFMLVATPEEKKYFKFSGVRNPLDVNVSYYHVFTDDIGLLGKPNKDKYEYIKKHNATFSDYFKKYVSNKIYCEWKMASFKKLDYVYKYENVQEEFSKILKMLKVEQIRPLPIFNETQSKNKNFESYYTKDIQGMTQIVFCDFMKKWGYSFPENWTKPTKLQKYMLQPLIKTKFLLQKLFHMIIDNPLVYKRYYNLHDDHSYLS